MFRGATALNLDAKGRLAIPGRYRDELAERCDGQMVVTVNNTKERCLWMYPLDEWTRVEAKVVALPDFDRQSSETQAFFHRLRRRCGDGQERAGAGARTVAGVCSDDQGDIPHRPGQTNSSCGAENCGPRAATSGSRKTSTWKRFRWKWNNCRCSRDAPPHKTP